MLRCQITAHFRGLKLALTQGVGQLSEGRGHFFDNTLPRVRHLLESGRLFKGALNPSITVYCVFFISNDRGYTKRVSM